MSRKLTHALLDAKTVLAHFRKAIRTNYASLPKSQVLDMNSEVKDMFRTQSTRMAEWIDHYRNKRTDVDPIPELDMLQKKIGEYIHKIGGLSLGGETEIETSSPEYWERFYMYIYKKYLNQKYEPSGKKRLTEFLDTDEELDRDWYCDYDDTRVHLPKRIFTMSPQEKRDYRVLVIGNGISKLPLELHETESLTNITSTDCSPTVVKMMRQCIEEQLDIEEKDQNINTVQYLLLDVRDMTSELPLNYFDLILDKGTIDSLWLGDIYEGEESEYGYESVEQIQKNISMLLREGGKFVVFSQYELAQENAFNRSKDESTHLDVEISGDEDMNVFVLTKS
jgi:hypothetical protein